MALTLKPMIVTGDGKSFESVEQAKEHELHVFIDKELERTEVSTEDMSAFIAQNLDKINAIFDQKPKKSTAKTRKPRKAKTATVPGPGLPESGTEVPAKPRATRKPAAGVTAAGGDDPSYPGTRIEPSSKHRDS